MEKSSKRELRKKFFARSVSRLAADRELQGASLKCIFWPMRAGEERLVTEREGEGVE